MSTIGPCPTSRANGCLRRRWQRLPHCAELDEIARGQRQILTLNVTTAGAFLGFVLSQAASPKLLLPVPFVSAAFGLLYQQYTVSALTKFPNQGVIRSRNSPGRRSSWTTVAARHPRHRLGERTGERRTEEEVGRKAGGEASAWFVARAAGRRSSSPGGIP